MGDLTPWCEMRIEGLLSPVRCCGSGNEELQYLHPER